MRCARCHGGPLVECPAFDEEATITLWRCITCGDRTDAVIVQHRHQRPDPYPAVALPVWDPLHRRLILACGDVDDVDSKTT